LRKSQPNALEGNFVYTVWWMSSAIPLALLRNTVRPEPVEGLRCELSFEQPSYANSG
jgi:hypothetical protein